MLGGPKLRRYQRTSPDPQVKPPPIASSRTRSPSRIRLSPTATARARGIDAAEVLVCSSIVTTTRSSPIPCLRAVPSPIRLLACYGPTQPLSPAQSPDVYLARRHTPTPH